MLVVGEDDIMRADQPSQELRHLFISGDQKNP